MAGNYMTCLLEPIGCLAGLPRQRLVPGRFGLFDQPVPQLRIQRRGQRAVPVAASWAGSSEPGLCSFDHAATEADLAVIEHHGLARRYRALRLLEDRTIAVIGVLQRAGLVALAVANLG